MLDMPTTQHENNSSTQKDSPKILDVEILPPRDDEESFSSHSSQYGRPGSEQRYRRAQASYGSFGTFSTINNPGCLTASVTFGLFLISLFQYGILAGIGFFVFHIIGSIFIAVQASKALMAGRSFSPWTARICNWVICYLLTSWLAGGFPD